MLCNNDITQCSVEPMSIENIIKLNRTTLSTVNNWISFQNWNNSLFQYGLPPHVFHIINEPINTELTEADLLCQFACVMFNSTKYINYLEIGVSVGKTFYQLILFITTCIKQNFSLSCLDIEKINPTLECLLDNMGETKIIKTLEVDTSINSTMVKKNKNFIYSWNKIKYYEADEFDKTIWKSMDNTFNLIFSDALHRPDALLMECNSLMENKLFDPNGFIYCFDDLESAEDLPMWKAVYDITKKLEEEYTNLKFSVQHHIVNGWLGQHEYKHHFGVIIADTKN